MVRAVCGRAARGLILVDAGAYRRHLTILCGQAHPSVGSPGSRVHSRVYAVFEERAELNQTSSPCGEPFMQ